MAVSEIRDPDEARRWLLQSLWLQRLTPPSPDRVAPTLLTAYRIAADGVPLLPLGILADFSSILISSEHATRPRQSATKQWPSHLARSYEDHVLGKLFIHPEIERAADALRRYTPVERVQGFAFVQRQLFAQHALAGLEIAPGILRNMATDSPEDLLREGYASLEQQALHPLLTSQLEALIAAFRRAGELLKPEDVQALEQRTALADMTRYVAHRQILRLTAEFEARLPERPVRPLPGRREVPSRIHDEDQYPIGGYSSISNRGSIESLLHSQLAYMEPEGSPDLFDVKFVRDELFYYSRDENQFLRRRRAFGICFDADLVNARVKDPALPAQRGVLALALVLTLIRRLTEWLDHDALQFEAVFGQDQDDDAEIYRIILKDEIDRDVVAIIDSTKTWKQLSVTSQLHVLNVGVSPTPLGIESAVETRLIVNGPLPMLIADDDTVTEFAGLEPIDAWHTCLEQLLQTMI